VIQRLAMRCYVQYTATANVEMVSLMAYAMSTTPRRSVLTKMRADTKTADGDAKLCSAPNRSPAFVTDAPRPFLQIVADNLKLAAHVDHM
jgi:hypothetical protein